MAYRVGREKSPSERRSHMKHKVTITIADEHGRTSVLRGAQRRLPSKLLHWLFGDYQTVYLLTPGKTVKSVDVKEVKEE